MVAPYAHVGDLRDLDPRPPAELMALTQRSLGAIERVYGPEGFNLGVNLGEVAGAGFAGHVHMHVVPALEGRHELHAGRGRHACAARGAAGLVAQAARRVRGGRRVTTVSPGHLQGLRRAWHLPGPDRRGRRLPRRARVRTGAAGPARAGDRRSCAWRSGTTCASTPPRSPRPSSRGLVDEGCDVLDIGMVGTEMVYYAVGSRELDGGVSGDRLAQSQAVGRVQARPRGRAAAVRRQGHPGRAAGGRDRGLLRARRGRARSSARTSTSRSSATCSASSTRRRSGR